MDHARVLWGWFWSMFNPVPLPCSPRRVGLGSGWQLLPTDAPLPVGLSTGRWGWGESQLCSQPVAQE